MIIIKGEIFMADFTDELAFAVKRENKIVIPTTINWQNAATLKIF